MLVLFPVPDPTSSPQKTHLAFPPLAAWFSCTAWPFVLPLPEPANSYVDLAAADLLKLDGEIGRGVIDGHSSDRVFSVRVCNGEPVA